ELTKRVDDPRVVHEYFDRSHLGLRLADDAAEGRAIGDVHLEAAGASALVRDLLGGLFRALRVEVKDDDTAALCGERQAVLLPEAARPARHQRHLALDAQVHGGYLPLNSGGRFWKKAWSPSAASSVRITLSKARISISMALSVGSSRTSSTASIMPGVAGAAAWPAPRPGPFASASVSPSLARRFTRPIRWHSAAEIWVPRIR